MKIFHVSGHVLETILWNTLKEKCDFVSFPLKKQKRYEWVWYAKLDKIFASRPIKSKRHEKSLKLT